MSANCHIRSALSRGALDLITSSPVKTREELRSALLTAEPRLRTLILHHEDCLEGPHSGLSEWEGPDRLEEIMRLLGDHKQVSQKRWNRGFCDTFFNSTQNNEKTSFPVIYS